MELPNENQDMLRPGNAAGLLLSCILVLVGVPSLAGASGIQSIDEARKAYAEGRFTDAAEIGEALGTSRGFALAAESLTIHAHYIAGDDEKGALLERAIGLARKAIDSDPDNAEGHLQLARAIGRRAQTVGAFGAAGRGYAEKIRESAENALRIDPELAAAHLSLGRWHAELVGTLGSFMARVLYRARKKDAFASFERALELAPDSKAGPLEYALGMLALDESKYREKARDMLTRAIGIPARDAYEEILHTRAVERLETLDAAGG